ncbi:GAF domain-containing protein [Shewanella glacialipiscicola]|uniref:Free methionine-R-sulfoxide reductase YebR n=1 Tax=Shewanella glacialipiscicola TaxID=614069 RepID=A0ABQ6J4G6_9GAMM|nr:GAF domain-containing protein [Shewanella glacialipiscicola]MCL1084688.1 GAF domain-containing protein [Shewanella glacialipiscicola]MCU7995208.1 GAF domain-containing protein [Shewanella glacialipiscicola]MCU8026551.1 GAF domain-containing protein [Shewanella glacialipiscicola]GIU13623.1 free methionine-R-sulfoxide reductase YebR [Shewanella glacialipiscicola]GMA82368.1 free methionine-R-sulfoxide reductase YebR [Shewanella glacialipiscicola]
MKSKFYESLNRQVLALMAGEDDLVAGMANFSALLNDNLTELNWVGFYVMRGEQLVLGPFQGKVACTRIPLGKGVCGTAALSNQTQRVADVNQFDGHIACDSASNSEIVVPVRTQGKVIAVLDIDSPILDRFDEEDQKGLELLVKSFESCLFG